MSSRPIVSILAVAVILFGVGVAFADAPMAQDDAATVDEGGTVTMLDSGETSLLANDTDAEGLTVTTTPKQALDSIQGLLHHPGRA